MTEENWRFVDEFTHYMVSDAGRVMSLKRRIILRPINSGGYFIVSLHENGKPHTRGIHRLVAKAFIPNLENKPQVNHKNGIKTDNRVENLEWNTSSENVRHSWTLPSSYINRA